MGLKAFCFCFFPSKWDFSYSQINNDQKLFPNYIGVAVNTHW